MRPRFAFGLVAAVAWVAPALAQPERMIPDSIPGSKRKALETYLQKLEKPTQWVPERARWIDRTETGVQVAETPTPAAAKEPLKEYLAEIRPHKAAGKDGPDRADIYWYRPNPQKGAAGITVKRTIDLVSGQPVGDPEVLVNYAPPMTKEERAAAVKLAYEKSAITKKLLENIDPKDVEVNTLFDHVATKGGPDGEPGDRVVYLQMRRKGEGKVTTVGVNLTRETIREQ